MTGGAGVVPFSAENLCRHPTASAGCLGAFGEKE